MADPSSPPDLSKKTTAPSTAAQPLQEKGKPKGLEPTRYGDWEKNGRCIDF